MYKKVLTYLALTSLIFGESYIINGESKELEVKKIENYSYIKGEDLENLGIEVERGKGNITLEKSGAEVVFETGSQKVEVNNMEFSMTNRPFVEDGEIFVDFDFVTYLFNYKVEGNRIDKEIDKKLPIGQGIFRVEDKVEKIISLSPGVTEKLYEIGAYSKLLARTDYVNYPEKALELPSIGSMYTPKVEKIIEMEPDIVIAETHFNEKILKKLTEAGIEVYGRESANKVEDILDFIIDLGIITDKYYEARGLNGTLLNKIDRTQYVIRDIEKSPSIYYIVGTGKGEYTAGRDTFIADLIRLAGAENTADDVNGWSYSLEKLLEKDPEYIFGNEYNINTMLKGDVYKGLSAITEERYFKVDGNIFNLSGPRLIEEGLKILVKELYGEEYAKELNY